MDHTKFSLLDTDVELINCDMGKLCYEEFIENFSSSLRYHTSEAVNNDAYIHISFFIALRDSIKMVPMSMYRDIRRNTVEVSFSYMDYEGKYIEPVLEFPMTGYGEVSLYSVLVDFIYYVVSLLSWVKLGAESLASLNMQATLLTLSDKYSSCVSVKIC